MIKIKIKQIFIILIIIVFSAFLNIYYFSNKLFPYIISFAENKTRRIVSSIINNSISKNLNNDYYLNDLFKIKYNNFGEILFIDLDNNKTDIILDNISNNIKNDLNNLNNFVDDNVINSNNNKIGSILMEVPINLGKKNYLLSYLGPIVLINLSIIGNSSSNLDVDIIDYGINNALVKVFVDVKVNCKVVIPFLTKSFTVENRIPLYFRIINGKVPSYYKDNTKY